MAFAGVSLIVDGQLCDSTSSPFVAAADSGYHLFVIEGARELLDGPRELLEGPRELLDDDEFDERMVRSRPFIIGGHTWYLHFYPCEDGEDLISVYLMQDQSESVEARFVFSFMDQPELRGSMGNRQSQTFARYRCHGCDPFTRRQVLERSRHMKNDSFTIRCDVAVVKKAEGQGVGSIESHFGNLLLSMERSDITFVVDGKEFPAHRCVLAARSVVFKEHHVGAPSVFRINGMEADVFERLLTFIYTGTISEFKKSKREETGRLLELLEAAERGPEFLETALLYSLKAICEEILACRYMNVVTVSDIFSVAERTRCPWLKDECVEFMKTSLPSLFMPGGLEE